MKRWMIALLLIAFVAAETSCVVRVKERRSPVPPPRPARAVVVY